MYCVSEEKDDERPKPKGSLKRSFKWFLERGSKKKASSMRRYIDPVVFVDIKSWKGTGQ